MNISRKMQNMVRIARVTIFDFSSTLKDSNESMFISTGSLLATRYLGFLLQTIVKACPPPFLSV